MSKVFVGGICFITGVFFSVLIGTSTSTPRASADPAQLTASNIIFDDNRNAKQIVGLGAVYVPSVRPADEGFAFSDVGFRNAEQQLDGLVCSGCAFDNVHLTYGGGAFKLNNLKVSNTTTLTLSGAAVNTVRLLELLNMIKEGSVTELPPTPTTEERKAKTPKPLTFPNFQSGTFIGGTK